MKKIQKPFSIHFVCRGNTYRSRLAAAYMDTLTDERFIVSSSGISASDEKRFKTVRAYTKAVAKAQGLTYGLTDAKTQTTDERLAAADVIVFMGKDVHDEAVKTYHFDPRKVRIWHIPDVQDTARYRHPGGHTEKELDGIAAETFKTIRKNCDVLYEYLTHTAWVDVVDARNQRTGLRLPMGWVTDQGLWHRGVHVVVRTSDGKYVVGKRVSTIVFAPGMLEISLGGGIDSGETPLQAAQRETREELGAHLTEKSFQPLFTYSHSSYHPHWNKRTRNHIYVYAATLPTHSEQLRPQPGEVAELRVLTPTQVRHMLRTHRMSHFGRLMPAHKLYKRAIAYSALP